MTSDVPVVPEVPPNLVNGPNGDVELNTWYHSARAEADQDTVIFVDDFVVAVTSVGVSGGRGFVVADAGGVDNADAPPAFNALTSK